MKTLPAIFLTFLLLLLTGYGIFTFFWPLWASDSRELAHMFDATKARAGNVIVGMEIVSNNTELAGAFGPAGSIQFSGRATVSGVYRVIVDLDSRTWVEFSVDEESIGKLPKINNDTYRSVWFMFSNQADALNAFGTKAKSGRATIVIDNYRIHHAETDAFNTADLVKAVRVD